MAADAMFTIDPEPWALMARAAARQPRNTPFRLTAMMRSKASSSKSTTGAWTMMPAMLAMMSSRPSSDTASADERRRPRPAR